MKQTLNEKITDHLDILQREISYRSDVYSSGGVVSDFPPEMKDGFV